MLSNRFVSEIKFCPNCFLKEKPCLASTSRKFSMICLLAARIFSCGRRKLKVRPSGPSGRILHARSEARAAAEGEEAPTKEGGAARP